MNNLKNNQGLVINSILSEGYYLEDGQGYDDVLFENTKEQMEILQKALNARENISDSDVLEFVTMNNEGVLFGNWYNSNSGKIEIINFNI